MAFIDVFTAEAQQRAITGVPSKDQKAAKVLILEYLLVRTPDDTEEKSALIHEYAKYNTGDSVTEQQESGGISIPIPDPSPFTYLKIDGSNAMAEGYTPINPNHVVTLEYFNSQGVGLSLGETSTTAYRGDRGKIGYDHASTSHAPSDAEANRPISDSLVLSESLTSASSQAVFDLNVNKSDTTHEHDGEYEPINPNIQAHISDSTIHFSVLPGLADVPEYTGNQGKILKVNATEDGTIWGDPSGVTVAWGDISGTLSAQTDLQSDLDGKVDDAQVLTDVPAGAVFTDTLYDDTAVVAHINDVITNPHAINANSIGLGNVDNTNDADKPISTATQTALDTKLDKLLDDMVVDTAYTVLNADTGKAITVNTGGSITLDSTNDGGIATGFQQQIQNNRGDNLNISVAIGDIVLGHNGPVAHGYHAFYYYLGAQTWSIAVGGVSTGSGVTSPLTTIGDLWTYDTDDQRLAVGTDGYVLSADSSESTGLKWIPLVGGGGGDVYVGTGTPVNNELAVWEDGTHVHGQSNLTYEGVMFSVSANQIITGQLQVDTDPTTGDMVGNVDHNNTLYESILGNPGTDDFVLSSKIDGTRSWVANGSGGGGTIGGSISDNRVAIGSGPDTIDGSDDVTWDDSIFEIKGTILTENLDIQKDVGNLSAVFTKTAIASTSIGVNSNCGYIDFDDTKYFLLNPDTKANIDGRVHVVGTKFLRFDPEGHLGVNINPSFELDISGKGRFSDIVWGRADQNTVAPTLNEFITWEYYNTNSDGRYTNILHSSISNALTVQKQETTVTSNGTVVTFSTEAIGGGDIDFIFDGAVVTLDCTPAATVTLTPGTDTVPVRNFIYVTSAGVLTASTTFPTGTYALLAQTVLKSASFTQTDGPFTMQRASDNIGTIGDDLRGRIDFMSERIRLEGAKWISGVTSSSAVVADGICIATTAGIVYQMHRQTWGATLADGTQKMYIVNDPDTPYREITNLKEITKTANGGTIATTQEFAIRLIGYQASGTSGISRIFISLPEDAYGNPNDAINDINNYDHNTIPAEYIGGAFNICRVILDKQSDGCDLEELQSTLGQSINAEGGGGGTAQAQTFSDGAFNIWNSSDTSKVIDFDASPITTANTRTILMADADVDLANLNKLDLPTIRTISGVTDTLVLTDKHKYLRCTSSSATTVTVPPNSSVAFAVGTQIHIRQAGTGQVTIAEGSGVTVNSEETLKLNAQHSTVTLIKVATDEWDLTGSIEAE